MDWIDIITFLSISEKLKGKDVINLCNTNTKLRNFCEKYSDTIWSTKLLKDFKITKDQIIGNPKSYYMGLENDIFQYYFYDIDPDYNPDNKINKISNLRIENITKENSKYDNHFKIPGTDKLSNINLVIGIFQVFTKHYGSETLTVYSKTLQDTLNKLIELKEEHFPSDEYTDISDKILAMDINTVLEEHLDINGEFISGVYYPVDVKLSVFEVNL